MKNLDRILILTAGIMIALIGLKIVLVIPG
jgi:hypothetical protein